MSTGNLGWKYYKDYFQCEYENRNDYDIKNENIVCSKLSDYNEELLSFPGKELRLKDYFILSTAYPGLVTGTGVSHSIKGRENIFKLGFHFDYTTGLPMIPGSTVKGLLRSYFPIQYRNKFPDEYKARVVYIAWLIKEINLKLNEYDELFQQELDHNLKDKVAEISKQYDNDEYRKGIKDKLEEKSLLKMDEPNYDEKELDDLIEAIPNLIEDEVKAKIALEKGKAIKPKEREQILKRIEKQRKRIFNELKFSLKNNFDINVSYTEELGKEIEALELEIFEGKLLDGINSTPQKPKYKYLPIYRRDIFHDATLSGNSGSFLERDYITPHKDKFKDPNPIMFLKVAPKTNFRFFFDLKNSQYSKINKDVKMLIFEIIIGTFGIGAKTNVGYGQFSNGDNSR